MKTQLAPSLEIPTLKRTAFCKSAVEAGDKRDSDLDDADKRNRPDAMTDARGAALVAGQAVMCWGEKRTLLGRGRGRHALLVGWTENGGNCYGTAWVSDVNPYTADDPEPAPVIEAEGVTVTK